MSIYITGYKQQRYDATSRVASLRDVNVTKVHVLWRLLGEVAVRWSQTLNAIKLRWLLKNITLLYKMFFIEITKKLFVSLVRNHSSRSDVPRLWYTYRNGTWMLEHKIGSCSSFFKNKCISQVPKKFANTRLIFQFN